jgi:hypothetical protein
VDEKEGTDVEPSHSLTSRQKGGKERKEGKDSSAWDGMGSECDGRKFLSTTSIKARRLFV